MMVFVGPTAGSFDDNVVVTGGRVDAANVDESFGKALVAFRHCRYVVLETSNGKTKMMRKEKYQATNTAIVTT
jgi:hypothetical protein